MTNVLYDGGFSTEGLIGGVLILTWFGVDGSSLREPDATWSVTMNNVTYQDHAMIVDPSLSIAVFPFDDGVPRIRLDMHVSDLVMRDNIAVVSASYWDSIYAACMPNFGEVVWEQVRFERNGCFADTAAGMGGVMQYGTLKPYAPNDPPATVAYISTEWNGNAAGKGAALYISDELSLIHISEPTRPY